MHYGNVLDNLPSVIWCTDKDLNITYINKACIQSGMCNIKTIGKNIRDIVPPETYEEILKGDEKYKKDPENNTNQKFIIKLNDSSVPGGIRTIELNTSPLIKNNKQIGYCGVNTDITTNIRGEEIKQLCNILSQQLTVIWGYFYILKTKYPNSKIIAKLVVAIDKFNIAFRKIQVA